MSDPKQPPAPSDDALRPCLRRVRFQVQARLAQGRMTVGELLALKPGSLVRTTVRPGGRIVLCAGKIPLLAAEPLVAGGRLVLRVEDVEDPRG